MIGVSNLRVFDVVIMVFHTIVIVRFRLQFIARSISFSPTIDIGISDADNLLCRIIGLRENS